jgi:hypothetical protein
MKAWEYKYQVISSDRKETACTLHLKFYTVCQILHNLTGQFLGTQPVLHVDLDGMGK